MCLRVWVLVFIQTPHICSCSPYLFGCKGVLDGRKDLKSKASARSIPHGCPGPKLIHLCFPVICTFSSCLPFLCILVIIFFLPSTPQNKGFVQGFLYCYFIYLLTTISINILPYFRHQKLFNSTDPYIEHFEKKCRTFDGNPCNKPWSHVRIFSTPSHAHPWELRAYDANRSHRIHTKTFPCLLCPFSPNMPKVFPLWRRQLYTNTHCWGEWFYYHYYFSIYFPSYLPYLDSSLPHPPCIFR